MAKINSTSTIHIALIPKKEVIIPPDKAPEKNERMIIKYRMERIAATVSFRVIARNKACEAERKLPVDIVVLNGQSTNFRNEETCMDATNETVAVTVKSGAEEGMKPIIKRIAVSKIKTIFFQSRQ